MFNDDDAAAVRELRVLVEHLRRENVRLSETIDASASAKLIADDAKARAAKIKQRLDNEQAFAALEKVIADDAKAIALEVKGVADEAKAVAAEEKTIADGAKALAVAAKVIADEAKAVAAQEKAVADEAKALAVAAKVIADEAKAVAAQEKIIADEAKALAIAAKVIADEAKAVAAQEKIIADEAKALAIAAKVIADEAKAVAAQEKAIADEAKSLAVAAKLIADEAKAVAAQEKAIADEAKALAVAAKVIADEAKAVAAQEKIVAEDAKALALAAKVIADEVKAATAKENKQDRAWSTSFQRALLPPRLPEISGCHFDALYEPGGSDSSVGGDWYDAVRLVDGRILISIGDVAGSGHEAAVIMGIARQIMRGVAQLHADPAVMLDAADRALRLEHPDVFVTAWVGVVDLTTRSLSYASAGHPPAFLCSPSGTVDALSDGGLPLGLRQSRQDKATTVALADGSTLVLYTDGLTEAHRDVVTGEARVRLAATTAAQAPWGNVAETIRLDVLDTTASTDDVAVLVVRFDFTQAEQHIQRLVFDVRDAQAARAARSVLLATLAKRGFPPIEKLNAELVFSELVGNVLRHAGTSSEVEIDIDCAGPQVILHVLDRGSGFSHISRLPGDLYCETGRGVFLIAQMTDDFTVSERPGGGSHVRAVLIGRLPRSLQSEDVRSSNARFDFAEAPLRV